MDDHRRAARGGDVRGGACPVGACMLRPARSLLQPARPALTSVRHYQQVYLAAEKKTRGAPQARRRRAPRPPAGSPLLTLACLLLPQVALKVFKDCKSDSVMKSELKARAPALPARSPLLARLASHPPPPPQALEEVQGSPYVCTLLGSGKMQCRDKQERTYIALKARRSRHLRPSPSPRAHPPSSRPASGQDAVRAAERGRVGPLLLGHHAGGASPPGSFFCPRSHHLRSGCIS